MDLKNRILLQIFSTLVTTFIVIIIGTAIFGQGVQRYLTLGGMIVMNIQAYRFARQLEALRGFSYAKLDEILPENVNIATLRIKTLQAKTEDIHVYKEATIIAWGENNIIHFSEVEKNPGKECLRFEVDKLPILKIMFLNDEIFWIETALGLSCENPEFSVRDYNHMHDLLNRVRKLIRETTQPATSS